MILLAADAVEGDIDDMTSVSVVIDLSHSVEVIMSFESSEAS